MNSKLLALAAICAAGGMTAAAPARAIDLNGPWATDASACAKVFVNKGGVIAVRDQAAST